MWYNYTYKKGRAAALWGYIMEHNDSSVYDVDFMNLIVDKADDLKVVDCDSHFSDFTGVHMSKIHQGKLNLMDIILPVYRETVMKKLCKKNSPFVYFDAEFINKDNGSVLIHCTGQNFENSTLCRLTLADVSRSQKHTEEIKRHSLKMDTLIDRLNGGICAFKVTEEMHIEVRFINDGGCRLFGTTKTAFAMRNYRLDELIHPDDRSKVFQAIGSSMATNEPFELDFRAVVHKGEYRRLLMSAFINNYDDKNNPVFYAILMDITSVL